MKEKVIILEFDCKEYGTISMIYDPFWDGPIEFYEKNVEDCKIIYTERDITK